MNRRAVLAAFLALPVAAKLAPAAPPAPVILGSGVNVFTVTGTTTIDYVVFGRRCQPLQFVISDRASSPAGDPRTPG